jgi:hypothetical protein
MLAGWRMNVSKDISFQEVQSHQEVLHGRGIGSRVVMNDLLTTGWGTNGPLGLEIPFAEAPKHELLHFVLDAILEDTLTPKSWQAWQGDVPLVSGEMALENVRVINAIEKSVSSGEPISVSLKGEA